MSPRAHEASRTSGGCASRRGCQAQCSLRSLSYFAFGLPTATGTPTLGHAAPSLIHRSRSATCSAESRFFGGIFRFSSA